MDEFHSALLRLKRICLKYKCTDCPHQILCDRHIIPFPSSWNIGEPKETHYARNKNIIDNTIQLAP